MYGRGIVVIKENKNKKKVLYGLSFFALLWWNRRVLIGVPRHCERSEAIPRILRARHLKSISNSSALNIGSLKNSIGVTSSVFKRIKSVRK